MENDSEHYWDEQARRYSFDPERDVASIPPRQPCRVPMHNLEGNLSSRVARAHDDNSSVLQLGGVQIGTGM
jgi:hypothetical protein